MLPLRIMRPSIAHASEQLKQQTYHRPNLLQRSPEFLAGFKRSYFLKGKKRKKGKREVETEENEG